MRTARTFCAAHSAAASSNSWAKARSMVFAADGRQNTTLPMPSLISTRILRLPTSRPPSQGGTVSATRRTLSEGEVRPRVRWEGLVGRRHHVSASTLRWLAGWGVGHQGELVPGIVPARQAAHIDTTLSVDDGPWSAPCSTALDVGIARGRRSTLRIGAGALDPAVVCHVARRPLPC